MTAKVEPSLEAPTRSITSSASALTMAVAQATKTRPHCARRASWAFAEALDAFAAEAVARENLIVAVRLAKETEAAIAEARRQENEGCQAVAVEVRDRLYESKGAFTGAAEVHLAICARREPKP